MLRHYLKTATRSLIRRPGYSIINIVGLAAGIACFALIALWVQDELRFDVHHTKSDRIVRITSHYEDENGTRSFARSYPAIGATIAEDLAGVESAVRFQRFGGALRHDDTVFNEDRMFFAEASIFDIFTLPVVRGDAGVALAKPNTAVFTQSAAQRYFGSENPIGKVVTLSDTLAFTVSAVTADVPEASHLKYDILLSFETWKQVSAARGRDLDELWTAGTFYTYALLRSPDDLRAVSAQLPAYVERYVGDQSGDGVMYSLALQPLGDIHLHSDLRQELGPNGNADTVRLFATIAVFVLLISCINFMNLSTARSTQRSREVGVRKAIGARRGQLIRQFLIEANLLSFAALGVAAIVVVLVLPLFNGFTGKAISLASADNLAYILVAVGLALIVGIIAGSYPAFLLSGFRPVTALKGTPGSAKAQQGRLPVRLRSGLVVVQFALSIAIIAGTSVAWQQLEFMRDRDLGFDQEQVLVVPFNWDASVVDRLELLKSELLGDASIVHVTASGDVPGRMFTSMGYWIEGMPDTESGGINALIVDPDFAETYGLEVVAGRDFSPELAANLGETFVLNESAVKEMGLTPEEVIGKSFRMNTTGPVVGVVRDFHFEGLQQELEPLVMTVWPSWFGYLSLRFEAGNPGATLAHVERTWQRLVPDLPFEYFFLDDDFASQYRAETQFGQVFTVFGLLAILISCLGLLGLAAYTTERRTKEVGIRKVLGASVPGIVAMLNREVTALVVIGALVAGPVAYIAMDRWLDTFAYHVTLSWATFVFAGLGGLALTWLTVAFQSIRAALADPVRALRYE